MSKSISILDKDYLQWVQELCKRYRQSQIKAAMHVNKEVLNFYWELGRDIVCREEENRYGSKFYATLSKDLRHLLPDADGLSERNLRYTKKFYLLYNESVEKLIELEEKGEVFVIRPSEYIISSKINGIIVTEIQNAKMQISAVT